MQTNFLLSKLALAITSAFVVSGCGSDESSSPTNSTYAYQNSTVCADTDLSGSCSDYESQLLSTSGYSKMVNYGGAVLTASEAMTIVTPFTTLIHSEMLFNPSVGNNVESAKASLQTKLGEKAGIDFSTLDTSHGPKAQSDIVLKSLKKAQNDGKQSVYANISHALDLMIANETFDLTNINVAGTPSRHMDLDGSVVVHGSQSLPDLNGAKSTEINPANGQLVLITSSDEVKQIDTMARNQNIAVQAHASLALKYDDDDDDDDDDDHYTGGTVGNLPGYQNGQSNQIIQLVPALNSVQAYKVYQPTSAVAKQASDVCTAQGSNGIFLTSIAEPLKAQTSASQSVTAFAIDTYAGASGVVIPTPTPAKPTVPTSSSACFNDNFETLYPLYQQKSLLAVKATSSYGNKELKLLDSTDLSMKAVSYSLKTASSSIITSFDETEVLILDSSSGSGTKFMPEIIDSRTLLNKTTLDKPNVVAGTFVAENQLLLGLNTNVIQWVTKAIDPTTISDLSLDAAIKLMATSPDGKVSAISTTSSLYVVDNVKRKLIKQFALSGSAVDKLFVLEDKVLTLSAAKLDYYQFKNIEGPTLKLAGQLVTKELLKQWEIQGNSNWDSTNLGYVLDQVGIDASIADSFNNISLRFRPTNSVNANAIQGVDISGLERGQWVSLYKSL